MTILNLIYVEKIVGTLKFETFLIASIANFALQNAIDCQSVSEFFYMN
jgi:hypothetical protein